MAALARHPTAITPRHYVICPTAPPDPADPAACPAHSHGTAAPKTTSSHTKYYPDG